MKRATDLLLLTRFALVGGSVAVFYVGAFTLLRAQGVGEMPANTVAFAAAICVQYIGQSLLTFRQPMADLGQILRFGLTVGLGYVVSAIVTGLIGPALGWADWISATAVAALLPIQNFILFRLWVYSRATA